MENIELLVTELRTLPTETPWVEFKHNNYDPKMIGRDISALANSAALYEKDHAYMVWGIDDSTHELVGTKENLQTMKKGNQELENWLRSLLSNNADFKFHSLLIQGINIGLLVIDRPMHFPVKFEKTEYIRVGSYTKKLCDYPSIQAQLWDRLRYERFESQIVESDLSLSQAIRKLDSSTYFELTGTQEPESIEGILHYFIQDGFLVKQDNGLYGITNLGGVLFSKKLSEFPKLSRKAIRLVQYEGKSRMDMLKEMTVDQGYVVGFEQLMQIIFAILPSKEVIDSGGLRTKRTEFPEIMIREALGNALIHQDFSIHGTGPIIEIFSNRIEITNSGIPLVDIERIIDNLPRSRNEKLAAMMRRVHICEELGTGWDKMIIACESDQLPAPKITTYEDSTRVTLYSAVKFSEMTIGDRLWALYLHACIKYVQGDAISNKTVRERFGLKKSSSASASRLIKDAVEKGLVKPFDPDTAPRYMKYIPNWA